MGYDFEIKFILGKTNIALDAMSRVCYETLELSSLVVTTSIKMGGGASRGAIEPPLDLSNT